MIPKTSEVRIEVSTVCNAACVFCPHKDMTRKKCIMSFEDFKFYLEKVLDENENIKEITFSGFGEIFLDRNILKKIEYAAVKGLVIHLLTNGFYLTQDKIDKIYEIGIKDIRISLHTADAKNYNKIMGYYFLGDSSYSLIRSSLSYLMRRKPKNTDIIVTADIVEENKDDVEDLIKAFKDECYLEIWKPHNWVYGKKYREGKDELKTCGRPFNGPIEIQNNGDVVMCCFDYDGRMVLGNLKEQSLKEIYLGSVFKQILKHHKAGTCEGSELICSGCDQLNKKKDVLIYSNRGAEERVGKTSTALDKII